MSDFDQGRRRGQRVTFRATVRLKFEDGQVFDNCQTSNISVSGVFVDGVRGLGAGDRCAVDFQLVGRSSTLALALGAEVVRVQEDGVALQFIEVDEDSFCHLQNIVYFNYRQEGQLGESNSELPVGLIDESLYLGQGGGKGKPLPDSFLNGRDDDYSGFDDELDEDIISRIGSQDGDDDY